MSTLHIFLYLSRRCRGSELATQTQSSMDSDRPRAGEAAAEVRTNEIGPILADMFRALSLNDSSPTLDHSD